MNFLAHAYLSFGAPAVLAGNMSADFVKGSDLSAYPAAMRAGIRLHRAIDQFTDTHPDTRAARTVFTAACGRYSGVFLDIAYDYFLANDGRYFPEGSLEAFARVTYVSLEAQQDSLPAGFRRLLPHMRDHDWLASYRHPEGVQHAFGNIFRRARYLEPSDDAYRAFEKGRDQLDAHYRHFMPLLTAFARELYERQLGRLAEEPE